MKYLLIPKQVGERACFYICDHRYEESIGGQWKEVVEDTKTDITKTPVYRVKRKLMLLVHGVKIRET